jgi:hypothetical protein
MAALAFRPDVVKPLEAAMPTIRLRLNDRAQPAASYVTQVRLPPLLRKYLVYESQVHEQTMSTTIRLLLEETLDVRTVELPDGTEVPLRVALADVEIEGTSE